MTAEERKGASLAKALVKAIAGLEKDTVVSPDILSVEVSFAVRKETEGVKKAVKHFMAYYEKE